MNALKSRPELIAFTERVSPQFAAELILAKNAPVILDVRAPGERAVKQIDGSIGVPLNRLGGNFSSLPQSRPLLVYCAGGYRSSIAASLLKGHGFDRVAEIAGGIAAWEAANLPVSRLPSDDEPGLVRVDS